MLRVCALLLVAMFSCHVASAADGNRLAYLDGPLDPYYPHRDFPKLITPQWVGEEGVECVVTLAIDDMRDSAKYEAFLRPILDRLKKIDGRAPVSIMSCRVDPADPQLQAWLKEGLSIDVHTYDHPCPMFQDGGLVKAKETYDKCVDLMNEIPGNKPVAYRMPCCDSKNTPTPRFWAEIFNKTTEKGNFLQIDSSVFNVITNKDKDLPKEITELEDGSERFRRYVPFENFVNTIEDYPYPYVIGGMCWEFPCVVPSDWSAQHVQQPNNPDTVRDWKLALDACVIKQGVFNLVFHPHGWIRNDQIVELIDHAVEKHGKKVKFLTFRECAERLNRNLLMGKGLRKDDGNARQVTLVDDLEDKLLDVYSLSDHGSITVRWWRPKEGKWRESEFPDVPADLAAEIFPAKGGKRSELSRDIDGEGSADLVTANAKGGTARFFDPKDDDKRPSKLASTVDLPQNVHFDPNIDTGLRLIDISGDGKLDCLFSNHERYSLHLFKDMKEGWAIKVFDVERGNDDDSGVPAIPPFVRADGTNNGAWFHSGALWLMNEDTWKLPDNVFKLTFAEMLKASGGREAPGDVAPPTPAAKPDDTGRLTPPARRENSVLRRATEFVAEQLTPAPTPRIDMPPPTSPAESLKKLHVRPGFKVELVAAEPLVVDPVAFDWGPDGRLWVVEMRDYPSGISWHKEGDPFGEPGGRVKVLTDTDGDGKYDKAEVFLDKLPFPTGIKVWRNGILVTAAPDILYAEDTDGDGKADIQKTLYRGFGEGNQQHRVNGLRWGLDNWLYVGNGDSGGVIKSLASLQSRDQWSRSADGTRSVPATLEVNVSGRDLRIRPDTGALDAQSGQTQFGRERDDWGNWFGGNNSDPLWHYTLGDHYLRRNPHATNPPVKKQVSVSPGAAPVYPRSKTLTRFNDANKANRYTSACGQALYRDELLGPEFYHNSFVCEPVHNLVAREIVTPQGATFTSRRAADEQTSEFLASEDNWFRPSMCRTGPDGALWVADMYRFVIEHPKWIPAEFQKQLEIRAGDDKGRIYRIYREGSPPRPIKRLDQLDTPGLVAALDSPNGPQRDLVQQMLLWRDDQAAVPPLVKLAGGSPRPQARLHALCTLDGFGALADDVLLRALGDEHPGVRRHAVRLSESRLAQSPELGSSALKLATDADPHIRQQVAYSLGAWDDPRAAAALADLIAGEDDYIAAAAASSLNKQNVGPVLARVLATKNQEPQGPLVERLLSIAAALGSDAAVRNALDVVLKVDGTVERWQLAALGGFLDALERRKVELASLFGGTAKQALISVFEQARQIAAGEAANDEDVAFRLAAIRLLGRGIDGQTEDAALLGRLLAPQEPPAVQSAAVAALARTRRPEVPGLLLSGWSAHTPALRQQVLDALLARADWTPAILKAIEAGTIPPQQLDARRRAALLASKNEESRRLAEKLLAGAIDANRQKLVERYLADANGAPADATRGKAVFAKRCANCHRLDGVGHSLGPDLVALTDRSPTALYAALLDPNRAVEDKFLEYVALTVDGVQHTGMLLEETGASLTLAGPDGKRTAIPRSEVEQLKSSGKSLMPEGLEKDVTPAELADLVAYLRSSTPPPKRLDGNQPEVVRPFTDGSIRLLATNARVYGPTVVLEEKYRNLGWWSSLEDHAEWSFEVPAGSEGEYRVTLDYSCADSAAGNSVVVECAGQSLAGQVAGTGSWDNYRGWTLGTIKLPAGPGELLIRSHGPVKTALLDLRGIRLAPVK